MVLNYPSPIETEKGTLMYRPNKIFNWKSEEELRDITKKLLLPCQQKIEPYFQCLEQQSQAVPLKMEVVNQYKTLQVSHYPKKKSNYLQ